MFYEPQLFQYTCTLEGPENEFHLCYVQVLKWHSDVVNDQESSAVLMDLQSKIIDGRLEVRGAQQ